jgi:hypothetical protein
MMRLAWIALAALVTACGGTSGATGPRPLRYHFKEQYLARAPAESRNDMKAALLAYDRARQESRKAASDHARSKRELDAARAEASRAHGQKESADSRREAAENAENNFQQLNLATRDQRVAEVTARAADQKVKMLEARQSFLEKWAAYTRENVFAAESRYELEKAKVARANNIAPPDFAYQVYVDQYQQRRKKADQLKGAAEGERAGWLAEQKEYQARRRDENEARGIDTAATSATDDDK